MIFFLSQFAVEETIDVLTIQRNLRLLYEDKRSRIPILPGVPESFADMHEFFVDLELEEDKRGQVGVTIFRRLDSYRDLVALNTSTGRKRRRLLLSGIAGIGKTTLVSKIAFDWAIQEQYLSSYELMFVLDIRWMRSSMDLIDVIQNQLLRRISRQGILNYLAHNASKVAFIFDGYDEGSQLFLGDDLVDIKELFQNKWLQESMVIVTTRPHKVAEFTDLFGVYAKIKLIGFSSKNINLYIDKFQYVESMTQDEQDALEAFKKFISMQEPAADLSSVPIMLSLMCIVWKNSGEIPERVTPLYVNALKFLAEHRGFNVYANETISRTVLYPIIIELGKPSLTHLLGAEDELIFDIDEFNATTLANAYHLGLVFKERHTFDYSREHVMFIHKTFQEFCAAAYWVSLLETKKKQFDDYLNTISSKDPGHFEYLLRFSCGLNEDAAAVIVSRLVSLHPTPTPLLFYQNEFPYEFQLAINLLLDAHDCGLHTCTSLEPLFHHIDEKYLQIFFSHTRLSVKSRDRKHGGLSYSTTYFDVF